VLPKRFEKDLILSIRNSLSCPHANEHVVIARGRGRFLFLVLNDMPCTDIISVYYKYEIYSIKKVLFNFMLTE